MTKYLFNTTLSTYLFKAGSIEIPPKGYKQVTEFDFKSGIFDSAILSGAVLAFDKEADIPAKKQDEPTPVEIEVLTKGSEMGATHEELVEFLNAKRQKEQAEADKYKTSEKAITTPSVEPVAEPVVTPPTKSKKKGAAVETEASTPTDPVAE